ncbi:hypothetical protein [Pediococcus parvulus]|uniref:hypothetical protein n=1 Tax=Pediococcus parvulus TaxID=54062 RepID=UPI000AEC6003|nr:hypothetical protein [Pediococcus parvulus]MDN5574441.1 hypothetical protein [Pediococcus sp.]GEL88850.1 hypothetical protein PPA04_00810 [Pediococcus parvulus]GHC01603.1 hypothetical protein GCM10008912_00720 [Pediococcus parvulus]
MTNFILSATVSNTNIALLIGGIIFIILFFKLIMSFLRFCLRHPIIFIILLLCGGLGFVFNFLLGGIIILAVIVGFIAFMILSEFNS